MRIDLHNLQINITLSACICSEKLHSEDSLTRSESNWSDMGIFECHSVQRKRKFIANQFFFRFICFAASSTNCSFDALKYAIPFVSDALCEHKWCTLSAEQFLIRISNKDYKSFSIKSLPNCLFSATAEFV